ncbi:SDR family oxidoreductase [Sorangium sp. So ce1182]|uniref:SDR family oxidoreductase n=1 Tax=Sorangium sp. So ce1182 TaxID=3133334 RepID=UPI003F627E6A
MTRVLVFGASSGIGRAIAQAFARAGASVGLAARRGSALTALAAELKGSGGDALALTTDVTDRAQVDHAVSRAIERFGGLDVVVNAAGVNTPKAERGLRVLTQAEWNRVLTTNLTGAFNALQASLTAMRERGGLIVQIASIAGLVPDQTGVAYQAAKRGVIGLCHAAMYEERGHGVRVTALLPGLVVTPMVTNQPTTRPPEVLEKALRPEDVAEACLFLSSLPPRVYVPEMVVLPGALQGLGQTAI